MKVRMLPPEPMGNVIDAVSTWRPDPLTGILTKVSWNGKWYQEHLATVKFSIGRVAVIRAGIERQWKHDDLVAWLKKECSKGNLTVSRTVNGDIFTIIFFEDDYEALTFYLTWHTGENQHEIE